MMELKSTIKRIMPPTLFDPLNTFRREVFDLHATKSYSQEGEDLILNRIFTEQLTGCYVDVGAHHPKKLSNTYLFYKRGWRGVNIDAMPGSMDAFRRVRPKDIKLEIAIAEEPGKMTFYVFNEPAFNTFDKELAYSRQTATRRVIKEIIIEVDTLKNVLTQHLPYQQTIDFLSIDIEGFDLSALKSNDWGHFRPKIVLSECYGSSLSHLSQDPIVQFLGDQGYEIYAKTANTVVFKESSFKVL
jgi:FkbM family methyltransferase